MLINSEARGRDGGERNRRRWSCVIWPVPDAEVQMNRNGGGRGFEDREWGEACQRLRDFDHRLAVRAGRALRGSDGVLVVGMDG